MYVINEQFQKRNPNIKHFFTTRKNGFSTGCYSNFNLGLWNGEEPCITQKNRNLLCKLLNIPSSNLYVPREIHKDKFIVIDQTFLEKSLEEQEKELLAADSLITKLTSIAVCVSTADCVPILCCDTKHHIVSAIHAGWRGIIADIVIKTINGMVEIGAKAENIQAIIGPCISAENYEVGEDVSNKFEERFPTQKDSIITAEGTEKKKINLREAVNVQLREIIKGNNIYNYFANTYTDDRFYSARRNGLTTGRFLSGIMLEE